MIKIYKEVRNHPITTRVIPITLGIAVSMVFTSVYGADSVTQWFFQSTDAYWGYGLGASSGFAFSEWLNRRAWQARDKEMERLRSIEKEHNLLRDEALKEKLDHHHE